MQHQSISSVEDTLRTKWRVLSVNRRRQLMFDLIPARSNRYIPYLKWPNPPPLPAETQLCEVQPRKKKRGGGKAVKAPKTPKGCFYYVLVRIPLAL